MQQGVVASATARESGDARRREASYANGSKPAVMGFSVINAPPNNANGVTQRRSRPRCRSWTRTWRRRRRWCGAWTWRRAACP